jgi:SsrA-binding protein
MSGSEKPVRMVAVNRKARYEYDIEERLEVGIELRGTEVKALREGRANLSDGYARFKGGELFLHNCHISPYARGNRMNHDPLRVRKLLAHRREIRRWLGKTTEQGRTIVPLRIYFRGPWVKLEVGLARGKKLHDKRRAIRERDLDREAKAAMKASGRRDG